MSVLVNKDTRLVVQGITGSAGSFHTTQCIEYGTNCRSNRKGWPEIYGFSSCFRYRAGCSR